MPIKNIQGQRFGRLQVVYLDPVRTKHRHARWHCICDCGKTKVVAATQLKKGHTSSCGCFSKELAGKRNRLRPYESIYNFMLYTAHSRGHEVSISYEQYAQLAATKQCHYCFTSIVWAEYNRNRLKLGQGYNIDRKDNKKGYSISNVVVCCGRCNRGKSDLFTYEEWYGMTTYLRQRKENNAQQSTSGTGSGDEQSVAGGASEAGASVEAAD